MRFVKVWLYGFLIIIGILFAAMLVIGPLSVLGE